MHQVRCNLRQEIEREIGRTHKSVGGVYSDRVIDIDLLLYGDLVLDTPELKLPHPLMHGQRRKKRFHAGRRIQKRMFRRKAPRSSSIKSGQGNDFPYPLFYFPDSEAEIVLLVAEISS